MWSRKKTTIAFWVLLTLWCAAFTFAQEPTPEPTPSVVGLGFKTWAMSLWKPGTDRTFVAGARAEAWWHPRDGFSVDLRVDASALSDGGASKVSLADPASFTTLELYVAPRYTAVYLDPGHHPLVDLVVLYGYTIPTEGKEITLESYPKVYGGGLVLHVRGGWAMLAVGAHEAAGPGLKLLVSGDIPVGGGVSMVADGAVGGPGTFLRTGVAYAVK